MRLEQENDDLAHELVTSKIALRNDLDQVTTTPKDIVKPTVYSTYKGQCYNLQEYLFSWVVFTCVPSATISCALRTAQMEAAYIHFEYFF